MQGETTSDSVKTEIVPQTQAHPHHHTSALFDHEHHPYHPRNVNLLHGAEQKAAGVNTRIAVGLTKTVGTMWTAYTFGALAVVGLMAIIGLLSPIVALLVVWISQTFLQLTLLPIIMVGQNVLGRKSELQADEQFNTTMSSYNDIEQVMQHLSAQDAELLRHTRMLIHLLEKNGISLQQLEAEVSSNSHLADGFAQSQSATDVPATAAPDESKK
jgi:ABC-type multidrug transport system fused ATPase/permease subunit